MGLNQNKKKEAPKKRESKAIKRTSTLQRLNDNYFYKNFAPDVKDED